MLGLSRSSSSSSLALVPGAAALGRNTSLSLHNATCRSAAWPFQHSDGSADLFLLPNGEIFADLNHFTNASISLPHRLVKRTTVLARSGTFTALWSLKLDLRKVFKTRRYSMHQVEIGGHFRADALAREVEARRRDCLACWTSPV